MATLRMQEAVYDGLEDLQEITADTCIRDKSERIFCDEGSLRHLMIPPWIWLQISHVINRGSFERPVKSDLESLLVPWRKTEISHRQKFIYFCNCRR